MRINDLVGETTEYDKKLKVELRKPRSWCKSISAFANTLGGALIFGVSDENEIIGLDNPVKDAEKISEIIKTKLNPIPEFKMSFRKVEDKILIILEVFKGDETPYYYYNDGSLEAYIRIGNESVKASPTELQRLVLRGRNKSYDSQKSMYKVRDYSFSKLRERYKKWTGYSFDEKNLISFGLADDEGYLTIAGSLIVDDSPVHHSRLFCTRWNGLNKSSGVLDALDEAEYEGSVISLIENGEAFIKRNAKMMWRKTANSREEMPDYVERSYHEALVNAIAHRDYLIYGSEVHIDIYDNRMEIYSPGGMPDGSIIQDRDPLTVPSTRRNPVLADIFNRLGYMERKGSGFAKIIDNYAFQINYKEDKKPYFRSDRYQFTVIMPNLNYSGKKEGRLNDQNRTDDIINDTINAQDGSGDIINDTINVQDCADDIINDTINDQSGSDDTINDQTGAGDIINDTINAQDGAGDIINDTINAQDGADDIINDTINDQSGSDDIINDTINDTINAQDGADDIINDTINDQSGADDIINDTINAQDGSNDIINDQNGTKVGTDEKINDQIGTEVGTNRKINDQNGTEVGTNHKINDKNGTKVGTNHIINAQDGTDNIINHQSDVKDEIEITLEELKILEIMKNKPDITIKQLTVILSGISNRTITRNIVILKEKGLLERIGSRKKGYWKVKR